MTNYDYPISMVGSIHISMGMALSFRSLKL